MIFDSNLSMEIVNWEKLLLKDLSAKSYYKT